MLSPMLMTASGLEAVAWAAGAETRAGASSAPAAAITARVAEIGDLSR